ncbi:MAG: tRNA (adenosine(37)-N6)-threonylcarbamoyltransferase complex ATPase subunit type 1 TsaE [Eubacterium sp.]|nr:tRNA (adenosine(37)-N6)-threonylcarbamoyltransferase complex ATPase subunit type 1 TsaE [Eubacterium sp.]
MKEYITHSYGETLSLALRTAKEVPKGSVIGFLGELGAGKTAFTCGFAEGLGINAEVSSPTFAICNEYIGDGVKLCHFDMYRIDSWDDLYTSGFYEALDSGAYVLCEWSENIFSALPDDTLIIKIEKLGENDRRFTYMSKAEAEV